MRRHRHTQIFRSKPYTKTWQRLYIAPSRPTSPLSWGTSKPKWECVNMRIRGSSYTVLKPEGAMLVNFLNMLRLFCMNSFFKKKPHREMDLAKPEWHDKERDRLHYDG